MTALLASTSWAQKVEFYTPNTVRIVKDNGQNVEKKSLVVIAQPEKVKVSKIQQGDATIYKSSALTVTVKGGSVSFSDNKGNLLTSEGESSFTPITKGPDTDAFRVKQTFSVEADEGIYGIRYSTEVPGHATHLVRLFPKEAARLAEGVTDIRMNSVYIQFEALRPVDKPGYKIPKSYPCERCGEKSN